MDRGVRRLLEGLIFGGGRNGEGKREEESRGEGGGIPEQS